LSILTKRVTIYSFAAKIYLRFPGFPFVPQKIREIILTDELKKSISRYGAAASRKKQEGGQRTSSYTDEKRKGYVPLLKKKSNAKTAKS
jgi:hypothetical protein